MTKKEIGDIPEWSYWRDFPPEWKMHKHDYGYGGVSCKVRSEPWMQNCRFYAHFADDTYIKDVLALAGISVSKDEQSLTPMGAVIRWQRRMGIREVDCSPKNIVASTGVNGGWNDAGMFVGFILEMKHSSCEPVPYKVFLPVIEEGANPYFVPKDGSKPPFDPRNCKRWNVYTTLESGIAQLLTTYCYANIDYEGAEVFFRRAEFQYKHTYWESSYRTQTFVNEKLFPYDQCVKDQSTLYAPTMYLRLSTQEHGGLSREVHKAVMGVIRRTTLHEEVELRKKYAVLMVSPDAEVPWALHESAAREKGKVFSDPAFDTFFGFSQTHGDFVYFDSLSDAEGYVRAMSLMALSPLKKAMEREAEEGYMFHHYCWRSDYE